MTIFFFSFTKYLFIDHNNYNLGVCQVILLCIMYNVNAILLFYFVMLVHTVTTNLSLDAYRNNIIVD